MTPMPRRSTLVVIGALYLIAAINLRPPYPLADLVASLPWLWEAVFGAAAIAVWLCALRSPTTTLQTASYILVQTAAVTRAAALWWLTPDLVRWLPPPNAVAWLLVAVLQAAFWLRLVSWQTEQR